MENQEYFKAIAEEVKDVRTKGEYTAEEMRIYEEGKRDALRGVLISMGHGITCRDLTRQFSRSMNFLTREKDRGRLANQPYDVSLWEKHLDYTSHELMDFVMLQFRDYQSRLKKAREIHRVNMKLLTEATQLTIE